MDGFAFAVSFAPRSLAVERLVVPLRIQEHDVFLYNHPKLQFFLKAWKWNIGIFVNILDPPVAVLVFGASKTRCGQSCREANQVSRRENELMRRDLEKQPRELQDQMRST